MKGKSAKGCYKKGGKVETKKEEMAETHAFKKGGVVHKAGGSPAKGRLDKKARGGKIATPTSPLSGAYPKGAAFSSTGENN